MAERRDPGVYNPLNVVLQLDRLVKKGSEILAFSQIIEYRGKDVIL